MAEKTVYDIVTERIVNYIEEHDELPWRKPWATLNASQQNFKSRKPYSGINVLLTGMSGFGSPFWLTYRQAVEMGGNVKKGEKATPVVYWSPLKKKVEEEDNENVKKTHSFGFYKIYNIFNAEQIEGITFPEPVLPDVTIEPIEEAERIIVEMPNRPTILFGGESASYSSFLDSVKVPDRKRTFSVAEYYSTIFHELVHSTGHPKRLNRFKEEGDDHLFGSKTYSKEELVAEIGSAFILNTLGINTEASDINSAAYIKGWLRKLKNDTKMVLSSSGNAGRAADYIMNKEQSNV